MTAFSSGRVTRSFLKYSPIGVMELSYLGGPLVNCHQQSRLYKPSSSTPSFLFLLRITVSTSVSLRVGTLGQRAFPFPCLLVLSLLSHTEQSLALDCPSLSSRDRPVPCGVSSSPFLFLFLCSIVVFPSVISQHGAVHGRTQSSGQFCYFTLFFVFERSWAS